MKVGDIIKVTFIDHCEDGDRPMLCTVFGRLTKRAAKYMIIKSWEVAEGGETDRANNKRWVIIRSCVKSIVRMVEEK